MQNLFNSLQIYPHFPTFLEEILRLGFPPWLSRLKVQTLQKTSSKLITSTKTTRFLRSLREIRSVAVQPFL